MRVPDIDPRVRNFLERQRLAHLATADAAGTPHVVPVCSAIAHVTLYVGIDEKPKRGADVHRLKRLRNIAANPHVAIVADVYDDQDWSRLGFVLLHATARVLEPADPDHAAAVELLRQKYPQYRAMALDERPVIAADIDSATSWGRLDA